jgi:hypothetical protein
MDNVYTTGQSENRLLCLDISIVCDAPRGIFYLDVYLDVGSSSDVFRERYDFRPEPVLVRARRA